jgi:hypothetical protein
MQKRYSDFGNHAALAHNDARESRHVVWLAGNCRGVISASKRQASDGPESLELRQATETPAAVKQGSSLLSQRVVTQLTAAPLKHPD